jgi:Phage tail tube protein
VPKAPAFFRHAGVKLNSIALEFTRSGPAAATISAIAQGETRFGTTKGGTPTSLTFSRISQFQGSIKRAGDPVGNLTGGSVTYSNNLEIETIRDDGLIEGAEPTIAALTGRMGTCASPIRRSSTSLPAARRSISSSPTRSRPWRSSSWLHTRSICRSPSLRSRARAACRRASTSAAPRQDADGDPDQRPGRDGVWLIGLPARLGAQRATVRAQRR